MKKHTRPLDTEQNAVLQDYASTLALKKEDTGALHMFFSPYRIPVGLTDQEVRICVSLYPLRKTQTDRAIAKARNKHTPYEDPLLEMSRLAKAATAQYPLPAELNPSKKMNRTRFKAGIWEFLRHAHL